MSRRISWYLLFLITCAPPVRLAPTDNTAVAHPAKEALFGTWRLISIDYAGQNGALPDPVFGPNPSGMSSMTALDG